jgi:hypothetical protein
MGTKNLPYLGGLAGAMGEPWGGQSGVVSLLTEQLS